MPTKETPARQSSRVEVSEYLRSERLNGDMNCGALIAFLIVYFAVSLALAIDVALIFFGEPTVSEYMVDNMWFAGMSLLGLLLQPVFLFIHLYMDD